MVHGNSVLASTCLLLYVLSVNGQWRNCTIGINSVSCYGVTLPFELRCSDCNHLIVLDTKILEINSTNNFKGFETFKIFDLRNIFLRNIQLGTFDTTPNLEEIFLSGNNLSTINPEIFNKLANLSVLDVSKNCITRIESDFTGNNMIELDLSHNHLNSIGNNIRKLESLVTLNVSNNNLTTFYFQSIPINAKTILASNNNLTVIRGCNISSGCFNPTVLDLSHNNLTTIDNTVFNNLNGLQKLFLQNNNLKILQQNLFSGVGYIKYLNLSFNSIQILPARIFSSQRMLEVLDVSNNLISAIDGSNFLNMYNLKVLFIQNNSIKNLDLMNIRENLMIINLDDNHFVCDDLYDIVKTLLELRVTVLEGNHGNTTNIYGNICHRGNKPQVKHFNSNIIQIVISTLVVCIIIVSLSLLIKFKCCKKIRSDELELMSRYKYFLFRSII